MLPFRGLSICLSHLRIVLKLRHNFFCIRQFLPDCVKIWLTSINPYLPKFYRKAVHLSVRDIRQQIAAESLQIAQWSQWRAYRKPPSLFRMILSPMMPFVRVGLPVVPLRSIFFSKNWVLNAPLDQLRLRVLPAGEHDRRCGQGSCMLCWMLL